MWLGLSFEEGREVSPIEKEDKDTGPRARTLWIEFRVGEGKHGVRRTVEKQGQASTVWVHFAMEHDFYPESQRAIRGTARVTWDWDEDRTCLELAFEEASLTVLREGKWQF